MRIGRPTSARTSSRAGRAALTVVALTLAMLPLMSGVADAAVTAVDAVPETANNQLPDNSHTITGTYTEDVTLDAPIRLAVTAGPNADRAGNGINAADVTCTSDTALNTFSCTYTGFNTTTTGTDTIRIFADNNSNNLVDAGEPTDDVLKTFAGPIFAVTMTPETDQAAVGTCNAFTVTVRDAAGNPNPGAVIDVVLTPAVAPAPGQNSDFCTLAAPGATVPAAPTNLVAGAAGVADRAEFTANAAGQITFGVSADTPGVINVRAFSDTDVDNVFDAGEPTDTSVKTFVAGGTEAITLLDATPETATNFVGQAHTITVNLTNAAGDTIAGVTPTIDITAGPNAGVAPVCTPSDQAGVSSCVYTGTVAGTDTIIVFVNQLAGATAGPDANEPQDQVTKTYVAAPAGLQVALTCQGTSANVATDLCINPTDDPTDVFTATVTADDGPDAGTARDPAPGVLVNFAVAATTPAASDDDVSLAPVACTTVAAGTCTTTLTNPNPVGGDAALISATINGTVITDTATKVWQARTVTTVTVTPVVDTNQTNTAHTVTATLTDQFGTPVSGANVDFTVAGRNVLPTTGLDRTTDATGIATFTYTDVGAAATAGDDVITAVVDTVTENDALDPGERTGTATKRWIPEATTPADVELDMNADIGGVNQPCNAAFGAGPGFAPTGNEATATNNVGTTHEVCAIVRTAGGEPLAGSTVTFTSTGVGHFGSSLAANHTDRGTTTTATVGADGYARAFLHSTLIGTQTVTATAGAQTDTGTKIWVVPVADARNVTLDPALATNPPGTPHTVTARVVDRFGNPVQGVTVEFTETGAGRFANNTSTTSVVTGDNGEAVAVTTTLAGETGTQTITATIATAACALAAGAPAGTTTAGNCTITATKTWTTITGALYNPVTPARILDTRVGTGAPTAKVGAAGVIELQVTGRGGVPATGVSAVVMNVTVIEPTAPSFLTVWPTGEARPLAANLNFPFRAGEIVENLVKVKVGANGRVSIYNHAGTVHIGADVAGWYGDPVETDVGSRYQALSPARILDTRIGTGAPNSNPVGAAATFNLQVTGAGGVPATGVTAVVLNVTAITPTASSFLTAFPTGEARPLAANLNYIAGELVTNRVIVKVGSGGMVSLYNHAGTVHLGADVTGYYTDTSLGGRFNALSPARVLDTRVGTGAPTATVGPAGTLNVQVTGVGGVPASGVSAVVLNVTVIAPTATSFLTVYPAGETRPVAADLNFVAGQTISILVIAKVGTDGRITMYNHGGNVHLGADVFGYFTAE